MAKEALIVLVGLPFSGKTDFIENLELDLWADVVSLEEIAYDIANVRSCKVTDKTWPVLLKSASVEFERRLNSLCNCPTGSPNGNIVVEGMYTSHRPRKKLLDQYGKHKRKIAVVMPTPTLEQMAETAIASKRFFSFGYMRDKLLSYNTPKLSEGFDEIVESTDDALFTKIWG